MALLSSATIGKMAQKWERAESKLKNLAEKTEESVGQAFQVIETQAACGGWSYANERYGKLKVGEGSEVEILGAPADVSVGALLVLGSFLGAAGKYREHLVSLGSGSIAAYTARKFAKLGRDAKAKSGTPQTAAGYIPEGSPNAAAWQGAAHYQPVG